MDESNLYKLSHEEQEYNRLDVQHALWTLLIGGLYPSEQTGTVERLLATSSHPVVLDVGCGSGIWAIEVAKQFPQAQVVGVDITPMPPGFRSSPENLRFIQHNLIDGLPSEFIGKCDIIHCRCVCQHVPNPQGLVISIAQCLKPNGLVFLPDGEWIAFDENREPLEPFIYNKTVSIEENIANTRKFSSYGGWLNLFGKITRSAQYQLPNILLKNIGVFEDIEFRECWTPIVWSGKDIINGEAIGVIMETNMKEFFQTTSNVVLDQGVPEVVVNAWKERATKEMKERRLHNIWYYIVAKRSEKVFLAKL